VKILKVIDNIDEETGGGATERTRQLSIQFSRLGHEVKILTTAFNFSKEKKNELENEKLKIIALPILISRFYIPFPFLFRIRDLVREAEIIHIVSHWSVISLMTYFFIRLYKKKYSVSPLGALTIFGRSRFLKRIYNIFIGRKIIQNASACIVATLNETPEFKKLGIEESNLIHIPNGINQEDYELKGDSEFRQRLGISDSSFILFIGRLNNIKGPDLLLEAFCQVKDRYSDLQLVYIGPDEGLISSLEKRAKDYNIENRVHFLGFVSREDKSRLINQCHFLTVPSRREAMSIVVLEAGIVGRPALITDQCGFQELEIAEGGLIVPASIEGIRNGIEGMMNMGEEINNLGLNLKELVSKNYLWSSTAKRSISVFKALVDDEIIKQIKA